MVLDCTTLNFLEYIKYKFNNYKSNCPLEFLSLCDNCDIEITDIIDTHLGYKELKLFFLPHSYYAVSTISPVGFEQNNEGCSVYINTSGHVFRYQSTKYTKGIFIKTETYRYYSDSEYNEFRIVVRILKQILNLEFHGGTFSFND